MISKVYLSKNQNNNYKKNNNNKMKLLKDVMENMEPL